MLCVIRTLGIVVAVAVIAAAVLWHPPRKPAWAMPSPSPSPAHARWGERTGPPRSVVYVAGAVRSPGLYQVRDGARAADAVRSAGGLRPDADAGSVNLAAHVADGDEIEVSVTGDRLKRRRSASARSAPSGSRPKRRRGRHPAGAASDDGKAPSEQPAIDVNAADATALAAVPGIGDAMAARIVEMRERTGPFASLDELLDVAGMTRSKLERARPYLRDL
jgi:competence protein ComEA